MTEGAQLSPGLVVAETYEIERPLGRGGMGEVWLARHRRLAGKQVAIKVLRLGPDPSAEALARFRREAEIAARLEHPNIVQVLDFNALPTGEPYLVMEFLKGESLGARAAGQPMPLEEVTAVIRQVGAALQAAHAAGVVHRDLKPDNIFLVPTALGDQVKVLDFGISKLTDSNTVQTTESTLIGTPLYMSPEQAMGNNSEVTKQSDVFSLGSICFELLSGVAPFAAENVATVVFRIAYEAPPDLRALRPDLPEAVVTAISHALTKDRAGRTADIEGFVSELTGQPLVQVRERSGVLQPGSAMTPSMMSGKTHAPSVGRATPEPVAPSGHAPPPAKLVSGKAVVIALVAVTVLLAGAITSVRMNNWKEREQYRSGMRDAGYLMLTDGTFVFPDAGSTIDAGEADADAGEEAIPDAGDEPDAEDAGVDVGAAPATGTPRPRADEPPTEAEQQTLNELQELAQTRRWSELWDKRAVLDSRLKTPRARAAGLTQLIITGCIRGENVHTQPMVKRLRAVATRAEVRSVKERCVETYPDAAQWDW